MFFTYWNDRKFNLSSKSTILLARFLHQQFCFLRQKISFFYFDCRQIGGCPLIHPRLCVHANRRWCGINNKPRSRRKTNQKKEAFGIFKQLQHLTEPCQISLSEAYLRWANQSFSESRSTLPVYLALDNWVVTIWVWQCKDVSQALEKFIPSRWSHGCWSCLYSSGWCPWPLAQWFCANCWKSHGQTKLNQPQTKLILLCRAALFPSLWSKHKTV